MPAQKVQYYLGLHLRKTKFKRKMVKLGILCFLLVFKISPKPLLLNSNSIGMDMEASTSIGQVVEVFKSNPLPIKTSSFPTSSTLSQHPCHWMLGQNLACLQWI